MKKVFSKSKYSLVLIGMLFFFSCKEGLTPPDQANLTIKITNSSGADFFYDVQEERKYYAPYPFNVGYFQSDIKKQEVMLISRHIDEGKSVEIEPIAKLSLLEASGEEKEVFIAVPIDDNLAIINNMDFSEFTVEQFSLKQIVEYWYSNRYGLQGTSIKGWAPSDLDDFK